MNPLNDVRQRRVYLTAAAEASGAILAINEGGTQLNIEGRAVIELADSVMRQTLRLAGITVPDACSSGSRCEAVSPSQEPQLPEADPGWKWVQVRKDAIAFVENYEAFSDALAFYESHRGDHERPMDVVHRLELEAYVEILGELVKVLTGLQQTLPLALSQPSQILLSRARVMVEGAKAR